MHSQLREATQKGTQTRQGPHLSIRIAIWILLSDTLFGDDSYCICLDHPNRETAMLSSWERRLIEPSFDILLDQHC